MLETFTLETFDRLASDQFRIRLDNGEAIDLHLTEAAATGVARPGARAPFFLLFRGPASPILPQQIYAMEHAEVGRFELFLVPLAPDEAGARYEAVFA